MSADLSFNRVLRRFGDDLRRPEYDEQQTALAATIGRLESESVTLRRDAFREWENAHVLLGLADLPGARDVLDFGGGNSPLAYHLAASGLRVDVVDLDPGVVESVNTNAARLDLATRLGARLSVGHSWPCAEETYDAVLAVSVFEGILRKHRPFFFAEARRVLRPGGSLLMTFDYGEGARFVSDPLVSPADVEDQILRASGMELAGDPFTVPDYDPEIGPPVKVIVPSADGFDYLVAEYSFGAVHLRRRP